MSNPPTPPRPRSVRSLLLGGVLPLVVYTFVEMYYGTFWGLIAGMVLGVGELISEKVTQGRVDNITWLGNGMLFVLGGISLFTQEGVWFKLQPAILEFCMAGVLVGSVILKKPFLSMMGEKQGLFNTFPPETIVRVRALFAGVTLRFGLFFLVHAAIATYAAFYWSTQAWVILKGVGFTVTMIVYFVGEVVVLRMRIQRGNAPTALKNS